MLHREMIEERLAQFYDACSEKELGSKAIKRIALFPNEIQIDIVLGYPCQTDRFEKIEAIKAWLTPIVSDKSVNIQLTSQIDTHAGRQGITALPQVKNIIAVASGKGGVGKSTMAINLALALSQEGANVGILDADIYGPSQPTMLGTASERPVLKASSLLPIKRHGIQSMSIGYLIDQNAAMVWRGPMIGKAMQQLLHDTAWENLDYLIVDLPPGTGDIQLTLCQKIPVSGAVMVTTPQDLALLDVGRACEMFNKLNVPILGVIENMSHYQCSNCGHQQPVFGAGGGAKLADDYDITLLGTVPLDVRIRETTDSGQPFVVQDNTSHRAQIFRNMAKRIAAKLSLQAKDYSHKFPKIVVENKG